jgi:hypothetical protein
VDEDLRFEDGPGAPRPATVVNRWLRELPSSGCPAPTTGPAVAALTEEGMRVMAAARTITPQLKETGAITASVDLSTAGGPGRLVDAALTELRDIDRLVNNVARHVHHRRGGPRPRGLLRLSWPQREGPPPPRGARPWLPHEMPKPFYGRGPLRSATCARTTRAD